MKRVMFRGIIMLAAMFAVVAVGQAVQADSWPPSGPGLLIKMSSGDQVCALFTAARGGMKVSCATKAGANYTGVITYNCAASGKTLTCTATNVANKTVNVSDNYASKCNQVCGPGTFTKF